jgi:hypothetical protein
MSVCECGICVRCLRALADTGGLWCPSTYCAGSIRQPLHQTEHDPTLYRCSCCGQDWTIETLAALFQDEAETAKMSKSDAAIVDVVKNLQEKIIAKDVELNRLEQERDAAWAMVEEFCLSKPSKVDPATCDHEVACAKCGERWHTLADLLGALSEVRSRRSR